MDMGLQFFIIVSTLPITNISWWGYNFTFRNKPIYSKLLSCTCVEISLDKHLYSFLKFLYLKEIKLLSSHRPILIFLRNGSHTVEGCTVLSNDVKQSKAKQTSGRNIRFHLSPKKEPSPTEAIQKVGLILYISGRLHFSDYRNDYLW